jgi:hypothetical protein
MSGSSMKTPSTLRAVIFVISALLSTSLAEAQNLSTTPPGVDWFARTISLLAFVVAFIAFIWGRVDKYLERKAAREARDPSVDLDITKGRRRGNYDYELKIINRGDVSVQVVSLSCGGRATIMPDDAEVSSDGRTVDYNGLRIERGESETLIGEINCDSLGTTEFNVTLRINEKSQRTLKIPLKRDLR